MPPYLHNFRSAISISYFLTLFFPIASVNVTHMVEQQMSIHIYECVCTVTQSDLQLQKTNSLQ